jgi:SAM-dependent methyltransferase
VEIDTDLHASLAARFAGTNVEVLREDATRTSLETDRFSGAVCLSMLHHVPSIEKQDALLAEAFRVLRPGGVFVGEDSLDDPELRALHHDDVYVPVDPGTLAGRLSAAGFVEVEVATDQYAVRFRVCKPEAGVGPAS